MPKICETLINKYLEHGHCNRAHDENTVSRVIQISNYLLHQYRANKLQIHGGYIRLMEEDSQTIMFIQRKSSYRSYLYHNYELLYKFSSNEQDTPIICHVCLGSSRTVRYIEYNQHLKDNGATESHQSVFNTMWICDNCYTYKEFSKKVTKNNTALKYVNDYPGRLNFDSSDNITNAND